jgi:hypothetical protein
MLIRSKANANRSQKAFRFIKQKLPRKVECGRLFDQLAVLIFEMNGIRTSWLEIYCATTIFRVIIPWLVFICRK